MTYAIETIAIGYSAILAIEFVSGLIELWKRSGSTKSPAAEIPAEEIPAAEEPPNPIAPPVQTHASLMEMLLAEIPMSLEEIQQLARLVGLRGWQFFRKQKSLRAKICPA